MPGLLENKLALILGIANKWSLAYAIAQAFSREGARLALTYLGEHQKDAIESLAQGLTVDRIFPCDVTRDEDLAKLSESLEGRPLDAVVHSLAFANREDLSGEFLDTSRAGFLLAQEVSAYSLVAVARAVAPHMSAGGSITTLTYLGSTRVIPHYNVMGVAKAALEASVRYLASDLGPRAIRMNAISAGPIKTLAASGISGFSNILQVYRDRAPLRRNVELAEVADSAIFLLGSASRAITGEFVLVDAGYHVTGI